MGQQAVDAERVNRWWILRLGYIDQAPGVPELRRPFKELKILLQPQPNFDPQVGLANQKSARIGFLRLARTHGSTDAGNDVHASVSPSD